MRRVPTQPHPRTKRAMTRMAALALVSGTLAIGLTAAAGFSSAATTHTPNSAFATVTTASLNLMREGV
ncbi:hypothetical protein [Nocardia panacis]|uniref:hypothetical protein n=1 Tax=Nocardia panacis TaxID=2340916 RepID=UPI0011C4ACC3|nr:hypothetical protein [Nocardia panacis]